MSDNGQLPGKLRAINPGKVKLRELAEIERLVGHKIGEELQTGDLSIDTMQALVWNELRKHDPAATFEQAGEFDMETLLAAFEPEEDEAAPLDPPSPPPSAASASSTNGVPTLKPTPASTTSGG